MKRSCGIFSTVGITCLTLLGVTPLATYGADEGYRVFRPEGRGPHPAVVFLAGCSGFKPTIAPSTYERPAEKLRSLGFIVVWADYLGRRSLTNCAGGGVTQDEAGRDAIAAADWLKSQADVDRKRISVIGWSWGGGSALAALSDRKVKNPVFSRVIVYFPYCQTATPPRHRIPILVLRGGADTVAPPKLCDAALKAESAKGRVKLVVYPGALHGFDSSELPPKVEYPFGTIGYDPKAAEAAWKEVIVFLGASGKGR